MVSNLVLLLLVLCMLPYESHAYFFNFAEVPSSPRIEYEVQNVSTGFRITCIFPDRHITECVVIVHPKFPLRHNFLSATLYRFRLGSVGNMVSGYIDVVDPNDFQITVIGGTKKRTRRTSTCT